MTAEEQAFLAAATTRSKRRRFAGTMAVVAVLVLMSVLLYHTGNIREGQRTQNRVVVEGLLETGFVHLNEGILDLLGRHSLRHWRSMKSQGKRSQE